MNRASPSLVLDPGHGGHVATGKSTPLGVSGRRLVEKDVVLDLCRRVASAAPNVSLTREADVGLPLAQRASRARDAGAAALVSVHADHGSAPSVWVHRAADQGSIALASRLASALGAPTHASDLALLDPSCTGGVPACLLELGDLRDPDVERHLLDGGLDAVADALAGLADGRFAEGLRYENAIAAQPKAKEITVVWGFPPPKDPTELQDLKVNDALNKDLPYYVYDDAKKQVPVYLVKHFGTAAQGEAQLVVIQATVTVDPTKGVKPVLTLRDDWTNKQAVVAAAPKVAAGSGSWTLTWTLKLDDVLEPLGAVVNENVIYAKCAMGSTSSWSIPIHVMRRRGVVILPGVLATQISIDSAVAWPRPRLMGWTQAMLKSLVADDKGKVAKEASDLKVIQDPSDDFGPYHINDWTKAMNAGFPQIWRKTGSGSFDERIYALHLVEYPYDWRKRPEELITVLLGKKALMKEPLPQRPVWAAKNGGPPSLATLIDALKFQHGFFGEKLYVLGHSTGGVILNGLVRTKGVQSLVERAYFVGTPFQGAVKVYNAFLTGSMDLGAIANALVFDADAFRMLSSNLPVLYYLAPTADYTGTVVKIKTRDKTFEFDRSKGAKAVEAMNTLVGLLKLDRDPFLQNYVQQWNPGLEELADGYHAFCRESPALIGDENLFNVYSVFSTKQTAMSTYSCVTYDLTQQPGKRYSTSNGVGDGTVTLPSLVGAIPVEQSLEIIKKPLAQKPEVPLDHVTVMGAPELWAQIATHARAAAAPKVAELV